MRVRDIAHSSHPQGINTLKHSSTPRFLLHQSPLTTKYQHKHTQTAADKIKNRSCALHTSYHTPKQKAKPKQSKPTSSPLPALSSSDDHTHERHTMGKSCIPPSCRPYFLYTKIETQEQPRRGNALPLPPKEGLPPRRPMPLHTQVQPSLHTHTHPDVQRHSPPKNASTTQVT